MAKKNTRLEFEAGAIVAFAIVGIYMYIAYTKSIFPFTASTKQKIRSLLFGPPVTSTTAPLPGTSVAGYTLACLDGSNPNATTGLCMNGQKPIQIPLPPPGAPGTVSNPLQPILTPQGGTGAVGLSGASGIVNPYQLYCQDGTTPDPTSQLCDDGSSPGAKPDQSVNQIFQQEMYKQLFLPYSQYPYLYGPNYLQGLAPQYPLTCKDGSTPNTTTNLCADGSNPLPNPAALSQLSNNPTANIFGEIPPIQGGDVPAATQDQQALQYYKNQQNEQTYGLFPPGGYTPNPQSFAPLPGTPQATLASGCFTVGNQTFCQTGGDPSNPPSGCITDGTNVYCPSSSSSATQPGAALTSPGTCFQIGNVTYCQSQADPSTPGCSAINGQTYCVVQSPTTPPVTGPPPSSAPPTTTPGTPSNQPSNTSEGCFNDNSGVQFCPCLTPVTGSVQAGGQLFCPQDVGNNCFTGSDGSTQYCPCSTATQGAVYANNQLYCVKPAAPTPPTTTGGCVETQLCVQGSSWDPTQCKCVPNTPATPTCPAGYNWDATNNVCVQIPTTGQPSCGEGETWDPTLSICHIACNAGFFYDPSLDTCRGNCPSGTSWNPTVAACVAPTPSPPPPVQPPPPQPVIPPTPSCPQNFEMSSEGNCVNCGTEHDECCGSYHSGNCHSECCHGSCMDSTTCQECLAVCGSYEGQCNCSSHTANKATAKAKYSRAMNTYVNYHKKQAYPAINAIAAQKRAMATAVLELAANMHQQYTPSAVSMRRLPRGGSWKISRS